MEPAGQQLRQSAHGGEALTCKQLQSASGGWPLVSPQQRRLAPAWAAIWSWSGHDLLSGLRPRRKALHGLAAAPETVQACMFVSRAGRAQVLVRACLQMFMSGFT